MDEEEEGRDQEDSNKADFLLISLLIVSYPQSPPESSVSLKVNEPFFQQGFCTPLAGIHC